ncbi:MAG: hypothetical protein KME52_14550 [Desmonostoc geniculatum HA4340-LM1]|jgi:hypothetical protein|nr:hypothetical protein [Desmonostoc geniculatum HA4340-LM1]
MSERTVMKPIPLEKAAYSSNLAVQPQTEYLEHQPLDREFSPHCRSLHLGIPPDAVVIFNSPFCSFT